MFGEMGQFIEHNQRNLAALPIVDVFVVLKMPE
jgi:hypothetical protein